MGEYDKFLTRLMLGNSDNNIDFQLLCGLIVRLGFDSRIEGSHHIFWKNGVEDIMNLQPKNKLAKPYQVKQVRNIILKYQLGNHDV